MRSKCDESFPVRKEVEHVTPFGTGRFAELQAIVSIGYHDEIDPWQIGRAAWLAWGEKKGSGFSPGTTTDETLRRKNWASCASKARHKWNLDTLTDQLVRFREDGGEPQSVSWQQMIARCDHLILHGSASESLRAIELKTKLTGKGDSYSSRADQGISQLIAEIGLERVRRGLEELGWGSLTYKYSDLFLEQKKMEDDNEQSGPVARRAGDDPRNPDGGRPRRVGDDAARKMDRGPADVGGAGAGQRPVDSRDGERA